MKYGIEESLRSRKYTMKYGIEESLRSISDEHFSGQRISRHKINWILRELEVTLARLDDAENKLAALCGDTKEDEKEREVLSESKQISELPSFHDE